MSETIGHAYSDWCDCSYCNVIRSSRTQSSGCVTQIWGPNGVGVATGTNTAPRDTEIARLRDALQSRDAEWRKALGVPHGADEGPVYCHDIACVVAEARLTAYRAGALRAVREAESVCRKRAAAWRIRESFPEYRTFGEEEAEAIRAAIRSINVSTWEPEADNGER